MQSTSKIISRIIYTIVALFLISTVEYSLEAASIFNNLSNSNLNETSTVVSSVLDQYSNIINLHYSAKNRRIWLSSARFKSKEYTVARLEKNASPEYIGAVRDIQILLGRTLNLKGREFLALTIAERTSRGNGMGQCGAGEEIYLKIYELLKEKLIERNTILIHSCAQSIDLYTDGEVYNLNILPITQDGELLIIKWLYHPKYSAPAIGKFNVIENRIVSIDRVNNQTDSTEVPINK